MLEEVNRTAKELSELSIAIEEAESSVRSLLARVDDDADATAACDAALSELEEAASSLLSAASEIIAQPPPPPPPLGLEKGPFSHFLTKHTQETFHHT